MQLADPGIAVEFMDANKVRLSFPWTWRSWGEKLTIQIEDESRVLIRSRSKVWTTLIDWGKNRANVNWAWHHLQTALAGDASVETSDLEPQAPPWANQPRR